MTLSAEPEDNFVKLGRLLLKLQVEGKDLFKQLIKESGLERRKAYYLAAIARQFDLVPIKDAQLGAIGWTRAQIISRYVTPRNWRELLELAQKHSAHDLKIAVSGDKPVRGTRSVTLFLKPSQYDRYVQATVSHGGKVVRWHPQEPGARSDEHHCRRRKGDPMKPGESEDLNERWLAAAKVGDFSTMPNPFTCGDLLALFDSTGDAIAVDDMGELD